MAGRSRRDGRNRTVSFVKGRGNCGLCACVWYFWERDRPCLIARAWVCKHKQGSVPPATSLRRPTLPVASIGPMDGWIDGIKSARHLPPNPPLRRIPSILPIPLRRPRARLMRMRMRMRLGLNMRRRERIRPVRAPSTSTASTAAAALVLSAIGIRRRRRLTRRGCPRLRRRIIVSRGGRPTTA